MDKRRAALPKVIIGSRGAHGPFEISGVQLNVPRSLLQGRLGEGSLSRALNVGRRQVGGRLLFGLVIRQLASR